MRIERTIGRREFLRNCLAGAVSLTAESGAFPREATRTTGQPAKSKVSIAHDPLLRGALPERPGQAGSHRSTLTVDQGRIANLLDRAMLGLFDSADPARCWAKVARPGQLVGLKVNTLGGRGLSSNVQLVDAICERLQEAGVRAQDIVIWDRDTEELERAGFRIRTGEIRCGASARTGWVLKRNWCPLEASGASSRGSSRSDATCSSTCRCSRTTTAPACRSR